MLHLEEEIRLHLAYLYPLAETVISDPTIWVLGYLATYYPEYIEKLTEAKGHQIALFKSSTGDTNGFYTNNALKMARPKTRTCHFSVSEIC